MPRRPSPPPLRHARSLALALLPLLATEARALFIADYAPETNDRFASGFLTQPVANTSASFVGAGYDLSGVGWYAGTGIAGAGRIRSVTLLTPLHIIQARHYPADAGTTFQFLGSDGQLRTNTITGHSAPIADISLGTFSDTFAKADNVAVYRVLDVRAGPLSRDLGGLPLLVYGSQANGIGPRVALATGIPPQYISLASIQNWSGANGVSTYWEAGDSGGPAFVRYTAPDGASTLTFAGGAYVPSGFSTLLPQDRFSWSPPPILNALTKPDGYALTWTIYDNPADTVRTAPQWTGAASALLSDTDNWSQSGAPADLSVLFDASAANGVTALNLDGNLVLRGALFKSSASPAGFTLSGTGTLTLGYIGLRNESSATQTFHVPVVLGDSQNWEAARGDLVFNAPIDTSSAAHLLVVGGDHDTTLNAPLFGAGALAKADSGTLTLNAVNTYSGKTWIHGGVLRLGVGGALPASAEILFDTTNPAALDLDGHAQTLSGLRSTRGGSGEVRLGGATLTLALADTNTFAGAITGSGTLALTGALRLGSSAALSASTNVALAGGVLELGVADYSATLGSGAGQLRFNGGGGFSAHGAPRSVTLNGGAPLVWAQANFVKSGSSLQFSSPGSDATVTLTNDLVLGTSGTNTRNVFTENGSAAVDARLSGNISDGAGTFTLAKFGPGTLELTGANTYKGATFIGGGALRLGSSSALPATSNIVLAGGVLELGVADYSGTLGSGAGQLRFAGEGGFSAAGANRGVNLGGAATPRTLAWGEADFVSAIHSLVLSSPGSDSTVDFRNPLVLGSAGSGTRTIRVDNGTASIDARLSGDLTQTGGVFGMTKSGAGTLELTGTNTYAGATTVGGGALRLSSAGALPSAGNVVLAGGMLELAHGDYTASLGSGAGQLRFTATGGFAAVGADRNVNLGGLADPAAVTWGAGDFVPSGSSLLLSSPGADATLTLRNPILLGTTGGASRTLHVEDGSAAIDARLPGSLSHGAGTFGITKTGAGTLELAGVNTYGGYTNINGGVLRVATADALSPNTRFALRGGGVLELAYGDFAAPLGGSNPGLILLDGNGGFSAAGATRTVTLNGGAAIHWGAPTGIPLNVELIFSSKSADATVIFANPLQMINAGPVHRVVRVHDGAAAVDARMSGLISQVDGTYGLQKLGGGSLELTAANTYRGPTLVQAGALLVHGDQISAVGVCRVSPGATLGGLGRLGGDLVFEAGSRLALATRAGVSGGPRVGGSVAFLGAVTVTADFFGGALAPGAYTLLTASGGFVGAADLRWSPPAGSDLRASFDFSEPGRIRLLLTEPTLLDRWRAEHFGEAASTELAADLADPDNDNLPNLLEYALSADPLVADADVLPTVSITDERLRLTFTRIADPALLYEVQASGDLASWTTIWSSTGPQNIAAVVSVDDVDPLAAHVRRFLRLRVAR